MCGMGIQAKRFLAVVTPFQLAQKLLSIPRSSYNGWKNINEYRGSSALWRNSNRSYSWKTYHRGGLEYIQLPTFIKSGFTTGHLIQRFALESPQMKVTTLLRVHGGFWGSFQWRKYLDYHHFSTLGSILRPVSLACMRSNIALRVLAFSIGKAAWMPRIGEAEYKRINTLCNSGSHSLSSYLLSSLEMLVLFFRATYLLFLFTPVFVLSLFSEAFGGASRRLWLRLIHYSLELAGAAFIKWGQWAATRPDLFPRDLCIELAKLQTKAPTHTFEYTKHSIESAFGRKINEIFEDFEEEPIASGSIAQVHRATLRYRYPGQMSKPLLVAVKVRHPNVMDTIKRDFSIITGLAKLSSVAPGLRWLKLEESVQQFAVFMMSQVDLAREAAHLSRFIYNFRKWKDVSFPKPLYPLVHPAVLVETYEQGENVSRFVEQSQNSRINTALAHTGTHTLLKMLLVDNFIHADMHPGNILVRMDSRAGPSGQGLLPPKPHVVYLDVGMTAELSKKDRANLLEFFKAVALQNGRLVAECALRFSKGQQCPNRVAFIKDVESLFKIWASEEGDNAYSGNCIHELLEKCRRHKVNVDGDVCMVVVTTMVLEGWQRKLDPDYNVTNTLQTLLFKAEWAKSLSYTIEGIMSP